jgi:hypothetical protein
MAAAPRALQGQQDWELILDSRPVDPTFQQQAVELALSALATSSEAARALKERVEEVVEDVSEAAQRAAVVVGRALHTGARLLGDIPANIRDALPLREERPEVPQIRPSAIEERPQYNW